MMAQKQLTAKVKSAHFLRVMKHGWEERYDLRVMAGICAFLLLMRMAYLIWISPYGLAPDEAQYWTWLAHNDWSFLTKPPMTTWLMGVSTLVFGKTLVGVKLFALVGQLVSAVLAAMVARLVAGRGAGWWAFSLTTTVPLVAVGGLIMSPDAVLLPLWMGALLVLAKMVETKRVAGLRWVWMGILVGLGGLAKYSAALFYPLLGVWMTVRKPQWWARPEIWVSGLIALAFQAPVVWWNLHHGWVGLEHVIWQTDGGGDTRHGGVASLADLLGSQALVVGPVVFAGLLAAWGWGVKNWRKLNDLELLLLVFTLPVFAGFVVLTVHSKVQANWPVLATVPGLVLLAVCMARVRNKLLIWLMVFGIGLNAAMGVILLDTPAFRAMGVLPLKAKNDPTKDMRGWPEMGNILGLLINRLDNPIIMSSRYQTLAPVMFHTPGEHEVIYVNAGGRRANQYDLWPWPSLEGRIVAYVSENSDLPPQIGAMFEECKPWHSLGVEDHHEVTRQLWVWVCWNAKSTAANAGPPNVAAR